MFEQLFGSRARAELIRFFLNNPHKKFYVREIVRLTDVMLNSVRRELENLIELGLIIEKDSKGAVRDNAGMTPKKYYGLSPECPFISDLTTLFSKGKMIIEEKIIKRIVQAGEIKYLALMGIFVDDKKSTTDLVIIGNELDIRKLQSIFKALEKEAGEAVRYTILTMIEYQLRKDIADRFLLNILENPNKVLIVNKIIKLPEQKVCSMNVEDNYAE
ncbi:MAG: hypothetical protein V1902_03525 [Candidatus Falkowbacteria bacterium]